MKKNLIKGLIALLVILFLGSYGYLLNQYIKAKSALTPEEVSATVESVSKLIKVDNSQEPLVATIQDASALAKEQKFYETAKNGDILVVYQDKAIIYRPSEDILVNVGPVVIQNAKYNIELRNGSTEAGATADLRTELEKVHTITAVKNAANKKYTGVTIVNTKNLDVTALQKQFNAKVVTQMPEGEAASTADVVIIKGK